MSIFDDPGSLFDLFMRPHPAAIVPVDSIPDWNVLPVETLAHILSYLSPGELFNQRPICKKWTRLISKQKLFPIHYLFRSLILLKPEEKRIRQLFYSSRLYVIYHQKELGHTFQVDYDTIHFNNQPLSTIKTYTTPKNRFSCGILNVTEIFTITTPSILRHFFSGVNTIHVTGYKVYVIDPAYHEQGCLLQRFFDEYFA